MGGVYRAMYGFRRQAHQKVRSKQYTLRLSVDYDMATFEMIRLYGATLDSRGSI